MNDEPQGCAICRVCGRAGMGPKRDTFQREDEQWICHICYLKEWKEK